MAKSNPFNIFLIQQDLPIILFIKRKWSLWARLLNCVGMIGGNLISLVMLFLLMDHGKVDAFGGIAFYTMSIVLLLVYGVYRLVCLSRTEPSHASGTNGVIELMENGHNQKPNNNQINGK